MKDALDVISTTTDKVKNSLFQILFKYLKKNTFFLDYSLKN